MVAFNIFRKYCLVLNPQAKYHLKLTFECKTFFWLLQKKKQSMYKQFCLTENIDLVLNKNDTD